MRIQLDPEGFADVPPGWHLVETEAEFLSLALDRKPLLIRGTHLCRWAEDFYQARGEICEQLRSPAGELRRICPQLTSEQAQSLAQHLGKKFNELPKPVELMEVARALWGGDWWCNAPNASHAAAWLLWWLEAQPSGPEMVLLETLAQHYHQAFRSLEAEVYGVRETQEAYQFLEKWLGMMAADVGWSEFPTALSAAAKSYVNKTLRAWVVRDSDLVFSLFGRARVSKEILPVAAEILARYYSQNPKELNQQVFGRIERYLSESSQVALRSLIPVPIPIEPPNDAAGIVDWYLNNYLDYRRWRHQDSELIAVRGRQFAEVYLTLYANAISGSSDRKLLSWMKAKNLRQPHQATLLIILDGLSYPDMRRLWLEIQKADTHDRLTLLDEAIAFAPLPSITQCAKPALIAGVTPRLANHHPPLGQVYSKDSELHEAIRNIKAGDLYIWCIAEPDTSYHKYPDTNTALSMAHGALSGIIQRLLGFIDAIPPELCLRLAITTDHGRLLASSTRSAEVPAGMNSHQRAALGDTKRSYPISGFVLEGNVAYLDSNRFELEQDCAVVISGETFRKTDGKSGTEAFPHGGIYPEEVLIPWWVIGRDVVIQPITVEISGRGVSTRRGTIQIVIENPNPVPVTAVSLHLSWHSNSVTLERAVSSVTKEFIEVMVPWPTRKQVVDGHAYLRYRLPGDKVEQVDVSLKLESEEMYERDNPLEDLL